MSQKKRFKTGLLLGHINLSEKQKKYLKIMMDPNTRVVLFSGPSGSTKTFLAFYAALSLWNEDQKLKILYLRSAVESASRSLGFLKGDYDSKVGPYMEVLSEKLSEILNPQETQSLIDQGAVEGDVINFLRGRSISNTVMILDEGENATSHEIETVLTRMNKNTKIFVCGDSRQSDLRKNDYDNICKEFDDEESAKRGIHHLEFTKEDIMRDPVIGFILDKLERFVG
jgi:phosphate starvation-inducible PhoH-like protein